MRFLLLAVAYILVDGSPLDEVPALQQLTQPVDHGEGPTWDPEKNLLYFVDIHAGKIYSYDVANSQLRSIKLDGDVSIVIPSKYNSNVLVAAVNRSVLAVEWDGKGEEPKITKVLTTVAEDKPCSRFNDGKADREGRLWFGTMGYEDASGVTPNDGALYCITSKNLQKPAVAIAPVNISNGLAWNKANDKFYYIDTPSQQVKEYDYDSSVGAISNPRIVFDVKQQAGRLGQDASPDGMTIDKDDNLWIALYNGGSVIKVDPRQNKLLEIVAIPALHVTSVAWGGPNYDVLFVTTSRYTLGVEERLRQPGAGALFALRNLKTNGLPAFQADVVD